MIPVPVFSVRPVILAAEKYSCNTDAAEYFFLPAVLMKPLA